MYAMSVLIDASVGQLKDNRIPNSPPAILSIHRDRTTVKKLALLVAKNHVQGADFSFFSCFHELSIWAISFQNSLL